ncbi:MAG: TetR/AcrR family transcriptional regulator [Candidatus Binataceae bacterium]|nr:TetR/AcrR family transcriptional regulator [Candidatus Binataceae bacterium]
MEILKEKPGTKRPVIIRAATSLFANQGIDATSMRDIAERAGVREAAIYRHFPGKEDLAREIFLSWYRWYTAELQGIVCGPGDTSEQLRGIVRHEFAAATYHSDPFVYFCDNELRFVRELPSDVTSVRRILTSFIVAGQEHGEIRTGDPRLLADMLSGALCAVALAWLRARRRKPLSAQLGAAAEACWRMIAV